MALATYLVSSIVMLLLVLGVGYVLSRSRKRESTRLSGQFLSLERDETTVTDQVAHFTKTPLAWTLGFIGLLVVALYAAMMTVSGEGVDTSSMQVAFAGIIGLALVAFLWFGIHRTLRARGYSHAMSTFQSTVVIGVLLILGVVTQLTLLS